MDKIQTRSTTSANTGEEPEQEQAQGGVSTFDPSEDIQQTLKKILHNQNKLYQKIDTKCDAVKRDLTKSMDNKLKELKDELLVDMNIIRADLDRLTIKVHELENSRSEALDNTARKNIDELSAKVSAMGDGVDISPTNPVDPVTDVSRTLIFQGVPDSVQDSELDEFALDVFQELGVAEAVRVVKTQRLKSRVPRRPGLVKVALRSAQERVTVLKNKQKLHESEHYSSLFIRGSKNHTERLLELNARTILRNIPDGNKFRITSNGRIVPKTSRQRGSEDSH